eukprot:TRINITY_DN5610_c0_g1_i1.p1 TRINITY_DN5610_c0_g1~~TRINITY_DN5610_c0_g1_i1.p1  ORF type:complete len:771 (-),score=203.83 TRINITY_DN5610_c0_g1_i1:38-2350(-)
MAELWEHAGMNKKTINQTLKNAKVTNTLNAVMEEANISLDETYDSNIGVFLYKIATQLKEMCGENRAMVVSYIMDGTLSSGPQVDAAIAFVKKRKNTTIDIEEFETESGVGVEFADGEVSAIIENLIEENMEQLQEEKYNLYSKLFGSIRGTKLKFYPNGGEIKSELDRILLEKIGPRTGKVTRKSKQKKKHISERLKNTEHIGLQESIKFPDVKDNLQVTPELLEKHLQETGGIVITRFPPEPNGYLHIGHAKSMSLNFGYSKKLGGKCIMRFDDTNPENEKNEYIEHILENIGWMGYEYAEVTHASDYFPQLYELALELIRRGYAYVCHQTSEEITKSRETHTNSPWRDRSVEENLAEFLKMKQGRYGEGEATLRMKMDMQSPNPAMWDHIAYRVKFVEHPHVGDTWCIYPSYDFTHCLNDSLENITHSLCTLEFENRHESYNWLLDVLGLYKPHVWEFGRLAITYTVMSKRRLLKLVNLKKVAGWDDPRMPTLNGYRRAGYTPESIKDFCEDIGVTRKTGTVIPIEKLERFCREHLNHIAHRAFAVFDPIRVTISNDSGEAVNVECPNIPKNEEAGVHTIPFTGVFYIERSDFRENDSKDYFGLTLNTNKPKGKWVRLKYLNYIVKLVEIIKDEEGNAVELVVERDLENAIKKPSGTIHWVSEPEVGVEPLRIEVRNYDRLFKNENPYDIPEGTEPGPDAWMVNLNENSLEVIEAYADPSVLNYNVFDKIQLERHGYYCMDPDSTDKKLVFNRTVSLKESKWKRDNK